MKPFAYTGLVAVALGVLALPLAWLVVNASSSASASEGAGITRYAALSFPVLFIVVGAVLAIVGRARGRRRR